MVSEVKQSPTLFARENILNMQMQLMLDREYGYIAVKSYNMTDGSAIEQSAMNHVK